MGKSKYPKTFSSNVNMNGVTVSSSLNDVHTGINDRISEEIKKVNKRTTRLDRFNNKSRWVNAHRHK